MSVAGVDEDDVGISPGVNDGLRRELIAGQAGSGFDIRPPRQTVVLRRCEEDVGASAPIFPCRQQLAGALVHGNRDVELILPRGVVIHPCFLGVESGAAVRRYIGIHVEITGPTVGVIRYVHVAGF